MQKLPEYAEISKISLTEAEASWIERRVLLLEESFKELESADTREVLPLVTVLDIKNVLREDISFKMLPRDELLANAPEQHEGYFQVPRTLE